MAKRLFEVGAAGEAGAEDALSNETDEVGLEEVMERRDFDGESFAHATGEKRDLIGERQVVRELVLVLKEVPLSRAEKDSPLFRRKRIACGGLAREGPHRPSPSRGGWRRSSGR